MTSATGRQLLAHHLRRFKLITFDVTDTLLSFRRPPEIEYARAVQQLGYGPANADIIAAHFGQHFRTMATQSPNFGRDGRPQITWETWWRRLIAGVLREARPDLDAAAVRRIADHLIDLYETDECWQKTPGAEELLLGVRAATEVRLGIISNFDPRLKWLLENVRMPEVDFVLASYEVGATKPSALIFDLALRMAANSGRGGGPVLATEALHVGNTPLLDYVGARAAGWCSVLISNGDEVRWRKEGAVNEQHVFGSLAEFYERLQRPEEMVWD